MQYNFAQKNNDKCRGDLWSPVIYRHCVGERAGVEIADGGRYNSRAVVLVMLSRSENKSHSGSCECVAVINLLLFIKFMDFQNTTDYKASFPIYQ